jgi:hypothetical protein
MKYEAKVQDNSILDVGNFGKKLQQFPTPPFWMTVFL